MFLLVLNHIWSENYLLKYLHKSSYAHRKFVTVETYFIARTLI